ncbi:uncharacterized protein LOC125674994 isoform X2 [Ostrea edulis]|uniref:uncharacterized protein LOC125674994 isoform X2 n=1 Tax=Ostrea edulis TaxID=37623 RepID=UPI0024AFB250|nr:uncharacterized protein LOC125674994 isoform X2 [Ostrea edulis]
MICTLCFITWISTFVQCASTPRGFCGGPARCCRGHKWDAQTESCVGCQHPYYGLLCQYVCDCTEPNCNMFDGCRTTPISTGRIIQHFSPTGNTFRSDISSFLVTTRPTSASQHTTKAKVGMPDTGIKQTNDIACCQHTWTFHTCTTHHNDIQMES